MKTEKEIREELRFMYIHDEKFKKPKKHKFIHEGYIMALKWVLEEK